MINWGADNATQDPVLRDRSGHPDRSFFYGPCNGWSGPAIPDRTAARCAGKSTMHVRGRVFRLPGMLNPDSGWISAGCTASQDPIQPQAGHNANWVQAMRLVDSTCDGSCRTPNSHAQWAQACHYQSGGAEPYSGQRQTASKDRRPPLCLAGNGNIAINNDAADSIETIG